MCSDPFPRGYWLVGARENEKQTPPAGVDRRIPFQHAQAWAVRIAFVRLRKGLFDENRPGIVRVHFVKKLLLESYKAGFAFLLNHLPEVPAPVGRPNSI